MKITSETLSSSEGTLLMSTCFPSIPSTNGQFPSVCFKFVYDFPSPGTTFTLPPLIFIIQFSDKNGLPKAG